MIQKTRRTMRPGPTGTNSPEFNCFVIGLLLILFVTGPSGTWTPIRKQGQQIGNVDRAVSIEIHAISE